MRRRTKIWLGVGAFVLTGHAAADAAEWSRPPARNFNVGDHAMSAGEQLRTTFGNSFAQEGEAGEGGEGGEGGINLETVGNDAAEYAIALQVIVAHYDAGLAAYAGGETEAGAQMFAHGLSEIYISMEDLFKKLGVTTLGEKLEAAVGAAAEGKPLAEVTKHVEDVRQALREAARRGPQPTSQDNMQAYLVGELIERAAAQYTTIQKDDTLEPYLDGLGFAIAARREAAPVLKALQQSNKPAAAAIEKALGLLERAYPGIKRPEKTAVAESELLVAASRARLAVAAYR